MRSRLRETARSRGYLTGADSMSTDEPQPINRPRNTDNRKTEVRRWTDWSVYKKKPEQYDERVLHQRRINWVVANLNLRRSEAVRQINHEDLEVPEDEIR